MWTCRGPRAIRCAPRFVAERADTTIEYKRFAFVDPDETLLLPARVESITFIRNSGVPRVRVIRTFTDYRRFLTTGTNSSVTRYRRSVLLTARTLIARAREIRPLLQRNAATDRFAAAPAGRGRPRAARQRPVPADGAEALRRLPDEHPHLHRGDGGDRPRLRIDGVGRQPDQRLRLAGRAVSRARAAGRLGRRSRRVDCRIAGAQRRGRARRRRLARDRPLAVGVRAACTRSGSRAASTWRTSAAR